MTIMNHAFKALAAERPAAAFAALLAGHDALVAGHDAPGDHDIHGDGIGHYAPHLAIDDGEGGTLQPTELLIHHHDYYDDPQMIASYADGSRMIAIPQQEFGILERPSGAYEMVSIETC
jgi:hypothetical protein